MNKKKEALPVALPHPLPVSFQQRFKTITGQLQKIRNPSTTPYIVVIKKCLCVASRALRYCEFGKRMVNEIIKAKLDALTRQEVKALRCSKSCS